MNLTSALCWGTNANGQAGRRHRHHRLLPVGSQELRRPALTGVTRSRSRCDARTTPGTARCWGNNADGSWATARRPTGCSRDGSDPVAGVKFRPGLWASCTRIRSSFALNRTESMQAAEEEDALLPKRQLLRACPPVRICGRRHARLGRSLGLHRALREARSPRAKGAGADRALTNRFTGMIEIVERHGGDVLKFGGDAPPDSLPRRARTRAGDSTLAMRSLIAEPLFTSAGRRVRLRMQGMHPAPFMLRPRRHHRELMITGSGTTETVECEAKRSPVRSSARPGRRCSSPGVWARPVMADPAQRIVAGAAIPEIDRRVVGRCRRSSRRSSASRSSRRRASIGAPRASSSSPIPTRCSNATARRCTTGCKRRRMCRRSRAVRRALAASDVYPTAERSS